MKSTKCSVFTMCLAAGMAVALAAPVMAQNEKKKEVQPTKAPAPAVAPAPAATPAKVQPSKDAKVGQPAADPVAAAMIAAATPGENHKLLAKFEGAWEGTVKMWKAPGETPTQSPTTAHQKVEMGGRYLYSHFAGEFNGQKFQGMGVLGYNNVLKKFQSSWIDNSSTGVETAAGSYDPATKTYSFSGEMTCPVKGGTIATRSTMQWTSDDSYVEKMYAPGPDGKEFQAMEITLKRAAAKGEGEKHEGKDKVEHEKPKAKGG